MLQKAKAKHLNFKKTVHDSVGFVLTKLLIYHHCYVIKKRISDGIDPDIKLPLKDTKTFKIWKNEFRGSLIGGVQSGCASGPLCEEPVRGVLIVLQRLHSFTIHC